MGSILDPLKRKIQLMIGRAVITAIDDTGGLQRVQLQGLAGEVLDSRERVQEYGLTSRPLPGAEAIIASIGGNRTNTVVIATDDRRYRVELDTDGEVCLYDDQDQRVHLKRDGIHIKTDQPNGVTVDAPLVTVTAAQVTVNSGSVDLGAVGGPAVARIGDNVQVGFGSSAGLHPIVEGSGKVRAAT